jgi:hypothetical protein
MFCSPVSGLQGGSALPEGKLGRVDGAGSGCGVIGLVGRLRDLRASRFLQARTL